MDLHLRPVLVADEADFRTAHESLLESDQFELGLNYDADEDFAAFVARHRNFARGLEMPSGLVPATFLVAVAQGQIVGRSSIRHELNDFLEAEGGHIGYGVLEPFRRQGYATEILRQSLIIARSLGIARPLLFCDEDNAGSATVIERCGGTFIRQSIASDGVAIRRYEFSS